MRFILVIITSIIFCALAIAAPTSLSVVANNDVLDQFNILNQKKVTIPKEVWVDYDELNRLRKAYVESLSFEELKIQVQHTVERFNAQRGYLPGLSPDWNASRTQELIDDYQLVGERASKLGNVVRNLQVDDGIMEFYRSRPNTGSLQILEGFVDWKETAMDTALFEDLASKLKIISIPTQDQMLAY